MRRSLAVLLAAVSIGLSPNAYAAGFVSVQDATNLGNTVVVNSDGSINVKTASGGSTQDTNLKQVNGATVNVGVGAASTGTQRVTTSTDSTVGPSQRTLVTLDVKTVTTGGTAVNAISAGHRTAGGFLQNPIGATIALCINEIGTASGTTSSGDTTCIQPGQSYTVAPAAGAVSVVSSDSSHPFSGYGLQ